LRQSDAETNAIAVEIFKEFIVSNLIHYFSSFDKLMKEKLVLPLFWLLIALIGIGLLSELFDYIGLDFLDALLDFVNLFVTFLAAFVGVRLLCELAVAIFRINDNLSPDHGVSELADIDPIAEARHAAEDAARRARIAADQAMERTSTATRRAVDSTKATMSRAASKTEDFVDDLGDKVESATDSVKTKVKRNAVPAASLKSDTDIVSESPVTRDSFPEQAALRPASGNASAGSTARKTRGRPKGSKNVVRIDPETGQRLKKDGTPAKKPGRKAGTKTAASKKTATTKTTTSGKRGRPKGSKTVYKIDPVTGQRLKKDGTPARKPGPKSKD